MDPEEHSLETKCENVMNIVVASRKKFGKMCVDYEQKSSLMENKILNLQIETFSNIKFKPKNPAPKENDDFSPEIDNLSVELVKMSQRAENLKKKLKNTHEVIMQMKKDSVGRRLREPIDAEVILAKAKEKQ